MPKEDFIFGQSKVEDFWKFINARHTIYLKRKKGEKKPWSDNPIFQEWKFTNVFRELDRGTIALRRMLKTLYNESVTNPSSNTEKAIRNWYNYIRNQFITCILYRMFNWHENAKFGPITNQTAWWHYLRQEQSIGNQIFGGAYMLPSQKGEKKLDTFERVGREIISHVDDIIRRVTVSNTIENECWGQKSNTLEGAWNILKEYKHIGPFIAYEFVCDLRYTDILHNATDTCTWCNIGPGAERGLQRMGMPSTLKSIKFLLNESVCGGLVSKDRKSEIDKDHWIWNHFRTGGDVNIVSGNKAVYPYWELREIEHCLCEFDKYERIRLGQGRPKAKFNGV